MAANAPPSLLIIKTETESEAPMFNLLLCKLFEGWLYGNCSLVLYIYRCTLCQGQGSCVGFILSFQGSVSEAICETGQIKLVLTSFFFFFFFSVAGSACRCHTRSLCFGCCWEARAELHPRTTCWQTTQSHPLKKATSPNLTDQLLTFCPNTKPVLRQSPPSATIHISGVSGRNYTY